MTKYLLITLLAVSACAQPAPEPKAAPPAPSEPRTRTSSGFGEPPPEIDGAGLQGCMENYNEMYKLCNYQGKDKCYNLLLLYGVEEAKVFKCEGAELDV